INGRTPAIPTANRVHLDFVNTSDAGAATLIANSRQGLVTDNTGGVIRFNDDSTGGGARVEVFGNASLSLTNHAPGGVTIGSLEGDGYAFLGGLTLGIGYNNLSTLVYGINTETASGATTGAISK